MSETNIVTDVLDVFRAAGFEVRISEFGDKPETIIYGTADNAGVLMESVLEHFGKATEGANSCAQREKCEVKNLAHAGVTAEPAEPLTIALGQGLIEVGQGHHGDERLPAILFGRNGAGAVGVETEGNRVMEPGECIAAVTFENYQSLDVVVEKLGELRMRIWPDAPHSQLSYGAAPHYRGYAHLGIGAYALNHSAAGESPELAISIATEAQKAGRVVGDMRDNEPGELVQPKDIAVRLRFENVAGLDALEQQLRFVRSEHFAQQSTADKASEVRAADLEREIAQLKERLEKKHKSHFITSQALHNVIVGNQSAWIEWQHGAGAEAAMTWIHNGLAGPGLIPDGKEAQPWFDANQDDRYEIPPMKEAGAAPSTADSANTGALGDTGGDRG